MAWVRLGPSRNMLVSLCWWILKEVLNYFTADTGHERSNKSWPFFNIYQLLSVLHFTSLAGFISLLHCSCCIFLAFSRTSIISGGADGSECQACEKLCSLNFNLSLIQIHLSVPSIIPRPNELQWVEVILSCPCHCVFLVSSISQTAFVFLHTLQQRQCVQQSSSIVLY